MTLRILNSRITLTGGTNGTAINVLPDGTTRMTSTYPWYRFLTALVDLYLIGAISDEYLTDVASQNAQAIHDANDPAARFVLDGLFLPFDENAADPRERLAQIIYGVQP